MDHAAVDERGRPKGAIKTFVIDWPVLLLIGLVFGALAPRTRWWVSRAFAAGAASTLAFAAVALISYAIAPDWMWMYFLDRSEASWTIPLIPIAYAFVYVVSFASGVALAQVGQKLVWAAIVGAAAMEAAVIALTWDRYHLVGSRLEWIHGEAEELFATSAQGDAQAIGLLSPVLVVVFATSFWIAWRARRAPAADR